MRSATPPALAAAQRAHRAALKARARANRNRDLLATAHLDGEPRATLAILAAATVRAAQASREEQAARAAVAAFLTPAGYTAAAWGTPSA